MKDVKQHRHLSEFLWPGIVILCVLAGVGVGIYFVTGRQTKHFSGGGTYVGVDVCRECHTEQAASWRQTRMANTFEVLRPGAKVKEKEMAGLDPQADYTRDKTCLGCHTTGYGRPGGFVSIEETPEMAGVSCEACHGPGGEYVGQIMHTGDPTFRTEDARAAGLVYPPTALACRKCHNEKSPFVGMDYVFDFEQRKQQGTHQHFELKYNHGNK